MPLGAHLLIAAGTASVDGVAATWSARGGGLLDASDAAAVDGVNVATWSPYGPGVAISQATTAHQPAASASAFPGLIGASFYDSQQLVAGSVLGGTTQALLVVCQIETLNSGETRTILAVPQAGGNAAMRIKLRAT